jgi:hypothetical protein
MGPFDRRIDCNQAERQEKPGPSNVQGHGFSSVPGGDANRWTIDESNRKLNRDPDLMYTGRSFRIPEA